MNNVTTLWNREPAIIIGAVTAMISLAVGFGLDITAEQVGLITAAVTAVLSLITRSQVTPTKGQSYDEVIAGLTEK